MDDEQFLEDDDLSAQDAYDDSDTEDSLSDDAEPFDADDADDAETDDDDDDPVAERDRLRAEIAERDRQDRERADRETQERYRAQQQADYNAQWKTHNDRVQAWNTYQAEKAELDAQRDLAFEEASQIGDREFAKQAWRAYQIQHKAREREIDTRYFTWRDQYDAAVNRNQTLLIQQSNRTAYAEHVRQAMNLPASALNEIMFYANGDPVRDVNDFPARAAELYERRKADANRKRQQTRQQKDDARAQRRGVSGVPGRTRAPANLREITEENAGDLLREGWLAQSQRRVVRSA